MKTTMQELLEWHRLSMRSYSETNKMIETLLAKEKESYTNIIQILSTEPPNRQYTHNNST